MGKVLNSMAGLTLVLMAQPALACPPRYHAESSGSSPWNLAIPLLLFLGIPALFFKLVAPSPLPLSEERKLFPLKVWSAVLGTFLLATLAFKERRTYLHKVGELLRQKIMFEGRFSSWRTWAKDQPRAFHRVLGMSEVLAATAVVGMWTWTVMDPGQTWGTGLEIPITFTLDTVLIWVCVRSFYRRVGFHLGVASLEPGRIMRGFTMVLRAGAMGSAAGLLTGVLFGLSCGVQTLALIPAAKQEVLLLAPLLFGFYAMLAGVVGALAMALSLALPYKRLQLPAHTA